MSHVRKKIDFLPKTRKSHDKEAAEEIRKKAMERMASNKKFKWIRWRQRQKDSKKRGPGSWILEEKAQSEYSIRQQELELQRNEQEAGTGNVRMGMENVRMRMRKGERGIFKTTNL